MVRRSLVMVSVMVALTATFAACSDDDATPSSSDATLPAPGTTDTLLPLSSDTLPPDTTVSLPPDALFGGDLCSALSNPDLAFLGRVRAVTPLSPDACAWTVGKGDVVVQLATPDEFATPAAEGEEIAPVDGVGLDAIGVDRGDTYEVYVQVENGYFSVTALTRTAAERIAAKVAPRATVEPTT